MLHVDDLIEPGDRKRSCSPLSFRSRGRIASPRQSSQKASESQIKFARNPIQKPDFRQIRSRQNAVSGFQINSLGFLHGRQAIDITDKAALAGLLQRNFAVLSAAPFNLTGKVAEAALEGSIHYLDLTEDVATSKKLEELSNGANVPFIP